MASPPDPISVTPSNLRRLARENQDLGIRLAGYEYRAMLSELGQPEVFDLQIDFPGDASPELKVPLLTGVREVAHLPQLNVTLGTIAWVHDPEQLPVIGIHCPPVDPDRTREGLSALITAHHIKPFARFVFLCSNLRIVPLLGRYQFCYEHIGVSDPIQLANRLAHRFNLSEIRNLVTGNRVWSAPKS